MPTKKRTRHCINCGIIFTYSARSVMDPDNARLYCSRKCTLVFQRASRRGQLSADQKRWSSMPGSEPSKERDFLVGGLSPDGYMHRDLFLKQHKLEQ